MHGVYDRFGKDTKRIKEEMDEYGIEFSEVIRKAIYEVKKAELKKLKEEIQSLKPVIAKVKSEAITKSIREDRET
jgi:predicted RNase H-like nuclease (RuvC/YqgF family)